MLHWQKACIAVHDWQQPAGISTGTTGRRTRDGLSGQCAATNTAFKQGTHTGANGQSLPFVSFDKGNYRYAVYGTSATMQGILVEQNGKRIANLNCQADRLSELDTAKLQRMGLSQDLRPLMLP
jgi:hypothetical protein